MKKILIFSVAYHPFVGGAEVAIKEITDRIDSNDSEFHMLTVNIDGKQKAVEQLGNVRVYRVGKGTIGKYLFPFLGCWKALKLHEQYRYNATWSMMANYAGFAGLFFKYLKPRVPFLLTLQEGDPIGYIKRRVWFVYPIFKQIFIKADSIQAISNYLAEFGKSMGHKKKIQVIPNGVDLSVFANNIPQEEIYQIQKEIGKNENDVLMVHTGRLVKKNGLTNVITALTLLPKEVKFLVIGSGVLNETLRLQAQALHVEDRVIFVPFVSQHELPLYLSASDIFIRPSLSEGMGNSFIEAMAVKKPVIGTLVGGIPDFLIEDKTGFVCKPNDPRSIANAVKRIMQLTPKEYIEITERAYELAVEKYDWNLIAAEMKERFF